MRQLLDLIRDTSDTFVEASPIGSQVLDYPDQAD
jgi:hypothetical protein